MISWLFQCFVIVQPTFIMIVKERFYQMEIISNRHHLQLKVLLNSILWMERLNAAWKLICIKEISVCWMMPAHLNVWTDKLQKSAENRADYNVSIGRKNRILNQVQVKTQYRAFVLEWDPTKNSLFLDGKEVFNYHSLESIKQ